MAYPLWDFRQQHSSQTSLLSQRSTKRAPAGLPPGSTPPTRPVRLAPSQKSPAQKGFLEFSASDDPLRVRRQQALQRLPANRIQRMWSGGQRQRGCPTTPRSCSSRYCEYRMPPALRRQQNGLPLCCALRRLALERAGRRQEPNGSRWVGGPRRFVSQCTEVLPSYPPARLGWSLCGPR